MTSSSDCIGIILAGGTGSRLYPCTTVTNKHLLPIGEMPMIFYPIRKLVAAGIQDILIVTGTEHMGDFISLLGSGKDFDCSLTYRVQDEAGGIAQALLLAERFANGQPMCVVLGDNIFENSIQSLIEQFMDDANNAHIMLKEVDDAERFGVAEIVEDRILRIIEKPVNPPSNFAVTGIYCYPPDVFDIIRTLIPSERGELEITDVNNTYLREGRLRAAIFEGYWSDAGTFPSLARANELVRQIPPRY
ncbi:MAG TPA: sugar phosphate nucleotidyltransferase [Candidatus Kapabacteria bacterium]|nr:sugar phosphate nucleotidyltransferase [Candidatus Kapabacteria bacterium]